MKIEKSANKELEAIYRSDLPEIEKIAQAFDHLSKFYLGEFENEIELLKAMNDEENLIKARIKYGMTDLTRGWFRDIYKSVTGEKAWDE
jgi:hypothetical protein